MQLCLLQPGCLLWARTALVIQTASESQCYAGFNLEQPAVHEMTKAFDPQRTGEVQYGPYIGKQQAAARQQILEASGRRLSTVNPNRARTIKNAYWLRLLL